MLELMIVALSILERYYLNDERYANADVSPCKLPFGNLLLLLLLLIHNYHLLPTSSRFSVHTPLWQYISRGHKEQVHEEMIGDRTYFEYNLSQAKNESHKESQREPSCPTNCHPGIDYERNLLNCAVMLCTVQQHGSVLVD